MEWISSLIGLIGVIVGAAIVQVGNFSLQNMQISNQKKSLASAFYGEISALLKIAQKRRYIEDLDLTIEYVRQTNRKLSFSFKVSKHYFGVYESNLDQIGLLPIPLPEKIVLFYTTIFAILEDIETSDPNDIDNWNLEELLRHLQEVSDLFHTAASVGNDILSLIEEMKLLSK